jgi:hypothetical protein
MGKRLRNIEWLSVYKHGNRGLSLEQIRLPRNEQRIRPGLLDRLREEICKVGLLPVIVYTMVIDSQDTSSLAKQGLSLGVCQNNFSRM